MTLSLAGIAVSLLTIAIVVASGGFRVAPSNFTATGNFTSSLQVDTTARLSSFHS